MEIRIPKADHVRTSLDGYQMRALDTGDADTMLELLRYNAKARGIELVSVSPRQFGGNAGYVVVTFDPKAAASPDDVCDRCWGSGDADRPWPSRRAAPPDRQERPRDRWNGVDAEMPQYAVLGIGPEAWVDLESAERYAVEHKHTDRSHVSIRVGTLRLVMKVLRAIRLDDFRAAPVPQGERSRRRGSRSARLTRRT